MPIVPLEGIDVTLFQEKDGSTSNYKSTTTDALGQFTFTGVRPYGFYKVKFSDPDGNYVTVYFGSGPYVHYDLEAAVAYQYIESASVGTITMPSGITIGGTVQGES
jgi:hypothetical protein